MEHKTFAFISYSRADHEVARYLHKRIEAYKYPREWVDEKNRPYDEKRVQRIFLDIADLSTQVRDFTEEIREHLAQARYLIVICTASSKKSEFVRREIDYFLSTHNNNPNLIVAVYVDQIFNGMHPVIDEIVATRNCPIFITGKGDAGHAGRQLCFFHILEFLLKVKFNLLYDRYEEERRKVKKRRMQMLAVVLAMVFGLMTWGLISENRRAQTEHARVKFERGIFPYSLVVGYVNNFLAPTMKALNDSLPNTLPHMFVYMPSDSTDLADSTRVKKYTNYLKRHYPFEGYSTENIAIPNRYRGASITRMKFTNSETPIYKDDARTVVAFNKESAILSPI